MKTETRPTKRKIIDHHKICGECRGYCCFRFNISIPKEYEGDIGLYADRVAPKDSKFIRENFEEVEYIEQIGGSFPERTEKTFTCKSYDPINGTCNQYSERPHLCRIYECECVRENKDPNETGSWNIIQKKIMGEDIDNH